MVTKRNWLGFTGGITVLLTVVVSLFVPWWQLVAGDNLVRANVSPIYTNFDLIGTSFTIPLLFALNISTMILMTAGGVAVLIYSLRPLASYSGRLLSFGYKKPLYSLILFTVGLIAVTLLVKSILGFEIPLIGSTRVTLPTAITQGATVSVLLVASFQWPFFLAMASAALCIIARWFHKKIATTEETNIDNTPIANPTPAIL